MLMYKKAASLAALGVLCAAQPVVAQEPNASQSLGIPANEVKYKDLGGPQLGTVWGDSATGAHGSFLRLHRGFVSPSHLHTGDYYGVIVEGSVTNAEAGQQEVVLGPGSYYFQKSNFLVHRHGLPSVRTCNRRLRTCRHFLYHSN